MHHIIALLLVSQAVYIAGQAEGEECDLPGAKGVCLLVDDCPEAIESIQSGIFPETCSFETDFIVCCPSTGKPVSKSAKECQNYRKLSTTVHHRLTSGEMSLAKEFPHMAALGFGDEINREWLCGGSLISDQYVLTAAHCLASRELGPVSWVRLGDLNINRTDDDAMPQDFRVAKTFRHPQYKPPARYNDIALIKLDKAAVFNDYVFPACLHAGGDIPKGSLTATGWGVQEIFGDASEHLMKVDLEVFPWEECKDYYKTPKTLQQGIMDDVHICAGNRQKPADTCKGDSGGPLQSKTGYQLYEIVGVTSFGLSCGQANIPGVYSRVSNYIPWIETIVWP